MDRATKDGNDDEKVYDTQDSAGVLVERACDAAGSTECERFYIGEEGIDVDRRSGLRRHERRVGCAGCGGPGVRF